MATPEPLPAVGLDAAEDQEDASPVQPADVEEVAGYVGTMESAIEADLLIRPCVPLTWHRWQIWRSATESRPAANRVGGSASTSEAALWRRIMLHYHGESWNKEAKELKDADWHEFLASAAASPELLNTVRDREAYLIAASRRQAAEGESLRAAGGQDRAEQFQDEAESAADTINLQVSAEQAITLLP